MTSFVKSSIETEEVIADIEDAGMNGHMPIASSSQQFKNTDVGNSNRLATRYQAVLRWVDDWKSWAYYDGVRWVKVSDNFVMGLAKEVLLDMKREAIELQSNPEKESEASQLGAWAYASEKGYHIEKMIEYARPNLLVQSDVFDNDPWLFNALDCTIDLRTGLTHPHTSRDMLTKVAGTAYDQDADGTLFMKFIDEITSGDTELAIYLQQVLGLSLTGDTSEKILWFAFGDGDNGKSVLFEITKEVLGDYAVAGNTPDIIDHGKFSPKPFGLIKLVGTRRVTYAEIGKDDKLNWTILKQMTGSDTMSIEEKFKNPINKRLGCKVFIYCNELPTVEQVGSSYWSRIRVIPFKQCFNNDRKECREKDGKLIEKLRRVMPAILRLLVGGEILRREYGLVEPLAVTDATKVYKEDSNILDDFIQECTVKLPGARTRTSALYDAAREWYREPGDFTEFPMNISEFGKVLQAYGYQGRTVKGRSVRLGIALMPGYTAEEQRETRRTMLSNMARPLARARENRLPSLAEINAALEDDE